MFTIQSISKEEIKNVDYMHDYNSNPYAVIENNQVIAYLWFSIDEKQSMTLDMIEVIEKEEGKGTEIIHFLFKHYSLSEIKGVILKEERSYYFWESLGADIHFIEEEGYSVEECLSYGIESPFSLVLN